MTPTDHDREVAIFACRSCRAHVLAGQARVFHGRAAVSGRDIDASRIRTKELEHGQERRAGRNQP
jgi:hypothetical protein